MGKTKIEWTEHSYNPVTGCSHAGSPGCDHCYARRMARRLAGRYGYPEAPHHFDVTMHPDRLEQPLKWRKPRMVFVCSMSDLFHEDVPFEFVRAVFNVMETAHKHIFQVLTKRPMRMLEFMTGERFSVRSYMAPLANVWLGVSVENQATADERIPLLLQTPATVRFVSCEPLLGAVDSSKWLSLDQWLLNPLNQSGAGPATLDWVIVGGESGNGVRPMHPQWARDIRDQCQAVGIPYFFKQHGAWLGIDQVDHVLLPGQTWADITPHLGPPREFVFEDGTVCVHVGKKFAGRLLDGREWNEFPNER